MNLKFPEDYIKKLLMEYCYNMALELDYEIMKMDNKYIFVSKFLVNDYLEECSKNNYN